MLHEFASIGTSYDPTVVVANSTAKLTLLLLMAPFSTAGGFLQMIAAIWIGFKHKSHGVPLLCVVWFFAHDTTYFINYHHWFYETPSWIGQGMWFEMAIFMLTEVIVMYQIMRYSREEVFPGMSFGQALVCLIGLQIFCFALFWWFWSVTNDSLYLLNIATTVILSPVLIIPMMRARGSRKGFNAYSIAAIPLLPIGFWPWMMVLDPHYFLQPMIVIVAIGNLAMALACVWYWLKLPPYEPDLQLRSL